MNARFKGRMLALPVGLLSTVLGGSASGELTAQELITNGGFETGRFTAWDVNVQPGAGDFFVVDSAFLPLSGVATIGPASGTFYAVSDQSGPGTQAIEQSFAIPATPTSVVLSFDLLVNNLGADPPIVDPIGLDHTGPPNQHARVDLLSETASDFDTAAGVIENFFLGADPADSIPNDYTSYSFDITALVASGETYRIRFAETDNTGFLNMGVDNVSVQFTPIPEPASAAFACVLLAAWRSRRNHQRGRPGRHDDGRGVGAFGARGGSPRGGHSGSPGESSPSPTEAPTGSGSSPLVCTPSNASCFLSPTFLTVTRMVSLPANSPLSSSSASGSSMYCSIDRRSGRAP